jgi:hypothetical protein
MDGRVYTQCRQVCSKLRGALPLSAYSGHHDDHSRFHVRSSAANLNRIAPVLEVLHTLPPNARFLMHSFSNGGAMTISLIARNSKQKPDALYPRRLSSWIPHQEELRIRA